MASVTADSPASPSAREAEDDHDNGPRTGNRPMKRRRIAVACGSCRNRKSRCDGIRPKCGTCIALDVECVYAQGDANLKADSGTVPKSYLNAVETRLATVEQALSSLARKVDEGLAAGSHRLRASANLTIATPDASVDDGGDGQLDDPTDGMGSIISTDDQDSGYFGPSSNIAFTKHITRAISSLLGTAPSPTAQESTPGAVVLQVPRPPSPRTFQAVDKKELYVLPPDEEADRLVQQYFSDTGMMYPYIHEETFMRSYREMRIIGPGRVRRSFLGLVNMILAQATATTIDNRTSALDREAQATVFFNRGVELCHKQMVRGTGIEVVQLLLVMAQFLQGTRKSIETWNIHGLAIRSAMQLGLHSQDASKRYSPLDKEIRSRVWFGCVVIDRILSMTLGRPPAVPDTYVKLPLPRGFLDATSQDDSLCVYNATITLCKVLWNVLETLYGCNLGCDSAQHIYDLASNIFQIEHQLLDWQHRLPATMTLIAPQDLAKESTYSHSLKLRVLLTLRYHNLRILVHRVVLDSYLKTIGTQNPEPQQVAILEQLGSSSLTCCVQSASAVIQLIHNTLQFWGPQRKLRGAWWYSHYYTFNAALVIFATALVCHVGGTGATAFAAPVVEVPSDLVDVAIEALALLDKGNPLVEKCAQFLSTLKNILESLGADNPQTGQSEGQGHLLGVQQHSAQLRSTLLGNNYPSLPPGLEPETGDLQLLSGLGFLNDYSVKGLFY